MGSAAYERVLDHKETVEDERMADSAVTSQSLTTQPLLVSSLDFSNYMWYTTVHQIQNTLAVFSIAGALYNGFRRGHRFHFDRQQQQQGAAKLDPTKQQ